MNEPTLELFLSGPNGRPAKWRPFVESLKPNTPTAMEGVATARDGKPLITRYAKELRRDVRCRTFEGQAWACWVVEE